MFKREGFGTGRAGAGLSALIAACMLLSGTADPVWAEDYDISVEDTADAGNDIVPDGGGDLTADLSGLIEVVGETVSRQGERLDEVQRAPHVEPVPATPPSDVLKVTAPEPYSSPADAAKEFAQEYRTADLKYCSDTLFYTCTKHETEQGSYYLTHVIVSDASQLSGVLSHDTFGGAREEPAAAAGRTGAAILLNGSYFKYETNTPNGANLIVQNNRVLTGAYADGYEVCLRADGTLFSPGYNTVRSVLAQDVVFTWGTCEDLLIRDGKPCQLTDLDWDGARYPRTAIGMVRPLEYYFITAGQSDYRDGITVYEEQRIFGELGCWYARGLDGGGSAALVVDGAYVNENGDRMPDGSLVRRAVADFVVVYEKPASGSGTDETETEP